MNLELKAGQPITDTQIADELNIRRTPGREGLGILEDEGLLIKQAKGGWKIYSLSLGAINEIFEIKMVLEGMLAERAAKCKDEKKRVALKEAMSPGRPSRCADRGRA